jgi:hypothetical protein
MSKYLSGVIFFILVYSLSSSVFSVFAQQPVVNENITISTYYPAPSGVYQSLQLFPTNPAPDTCADAADLGKMYYNSSTYQLMLCQRDQTTGNINWQIVGGGIPSGAIMMFTGTCPSGWSRFAALDNRFPRGASAYGATGGSGSHNHAVWTGDAQPYDRAFYGGNCAGNWDGRFVYNLCWGLSDKYRHVHSVGIGAANNLPSYLDIIFCQKN